ncbi:50S ribosomal protein L11 methyltransferase [Mucilaginibacter sp.]|jgi:protein arginine N-methyltransferase 1|uniref:50S ribosomal protein L11 methyltransferase n=1 Tax=Mucilaginibacter sp. TaxID=1882438 RepID=UPI002C7E34AF|nr:50S ribosomal protein L11 methyltransferase [Mucilaginibacter sp.]HTI60175.1 50S ribosomal protein L11 methyltransferase [Mucilaginibacter sp.]
MMKLKPETILKRGSGVEIRMDSLHMIQVIVNNKRSGFRNLALVILSVFSQPLTMREGLRKIKVSGVQNWVEASSTICKLWVLGALCDYNENQFSPDKNLASFGSSPIHIAMLNDRVRTNKFEKAIKQVVRKGDVVVDIGTGTGILAIAAARAGAKKVYAIEAGSMADVAQAVINTTEYTDRITLIRSWSTQVELPEKADVLVSEIIGNDPFDENVLPVFFDARQRLLTPGARLIPGSIKVIGLPVQVPERMLKNRILHEADLVNWEKWYDIDFSALKNIDADLSKHLIKLDTERLKNVAIFNDPLVLAEVDLNAITNLKIDNYVSGTVAHEFNGLLIHFELGLDDLLLSNQPGLPDRATSWVNFVWYLPGAAKLKIGDDYTINYKYSGGRDSEIRLLHNDELTG